MVFFQNLHFTGANIYFDIEYLIRMFFTGCTFDGGRKAFRNARFMQSYYFHNCTFRHFTDAILYGVGETPFLDISFSQCLIEHSRMVASVYSCHGVSFYQCCIEGIYGVAFLLTGDIRGLCISGCYFEGNNNGAYVPDESIVADYQDGNGNTIDLSSTVGPIQNIVIENNHFLYKSDNEIIILRSTPYTYGKVVILNNWVNPAAPNGAKLVKTSSDNTIIRNDVIYSGNNAASNDLISGTQRIFDNAKNGIGYMNELVDTDNCDALDPGYYHGADNNSISNAPTTREFYLMNILSNTGMAQLAITGSGVKSRVGTGAWV